MPVEPDSTGGRKILDEMLRKLGHPKTFEAFVAPTLISLDASR